MVEASSHMTADEETHVVLVVGGGGGGGIHVSGSACICSAVCGPVLSTYTDSGMCILFFFRYIACMSANVYTCMQMLAFSVHRCVYKRLSVSLILSRVYILIGTNWSDNSLY